MRGGGYGFQQSFGEKKGARVKKGPGKKPGRGEWVGIAANERELASRVSKSRGEGENVIGKGGREGFGSWMGGK